ncbi:recombinase family protein [Massilia sp. DJPM01]|uniref:recombinase family protein n=1 Tax=Massilia sp. DJPM01 TaxID=3024404 RepID=UPI00259E5A2D|nr:recombinase family protein [Massilia sp. DJPM01]MDM5182094.1 recombinase family protein [Massilia sp. DJPM01]
MSEKLTYGYARTSTLEQREGLVDQVQRLEAAGCDVIVAEQVSATDIEGRIKWAELLGKLKGGDVVCITKIDRAARSISDMVSITKAIAEAGASIRILDMNIDTTTPAGALMLNIFSSVAQFERDTMLERQRIGIEGKKRLDKNLPLDQRTYKGRAPTAMKKADSVRALLALGTKSKQQVAEELGIGVASIYRILKADKKK